MAFLGAKIKIEPHTYKLILGICLIIATMRLLGLFGKPKETLKPINLPFAIAIGAILGFVSGMIGIGGGILLSPVILLLGWANLKQTAAISAAFIFLNSIAGLYGILQSSQTIPTEIGIWVVAAVVGGLLGAFYGSGRFNFKVLRYILSLVLLFASYTLILGK